MAKGALVTHPASREEWVGAALAFAVLGIGLVVVESIGGDRTALEVTARAAAAALLGIVVAAIWWATSWLGDHGWHYGPRDDGKG
jgi:hypothetical protein